ncbi:restriction endonuclease subunit S [Vibrio lentus]|uniref:restriction endonuclease subunit S n=1 Tax=Vibrio lentus TaxID=136468 RepID=UPI000C854A6B|nr:restriction endonuclease subunit S [Vibrio lentus]PMI41958.1 type I restriction endonuclease subunit S [Vibrio lentus]PMJ57330.1 type I restriction endonuclease subunit S [Vibrio lentus]PMN04594.1 type I restriction endonuclease subunit S [Vibrio lentus]
MGNEWINTELGDVIELKRGYDLPKTKRINGSVPVVSSSGHSGLHNEVKIKSPGVVTGRYGTIGQVFYIEEDFWPLNTTLYVKDFKGNDPLFIYYYLKTVSYKDYTDKGAVPGVNRNDLHRAKVSVPKCPKYQNKLATHLRDLDKKITLNNQINQTLEKMAQTLFKSWFVDFDPVKAKMNGEQPKGVDAPFLSKEVASLFPEKLDSETGIPVGWSQGVIADIAKLNAKSWTKKNQPEQVHYVDLANTKNGVIETVTSYDFSEAPSRARRILNFGDTIVGTVRPGNRSFAFIGDTEQPLTGSTGFAVLSPKEECWTSFVYLATTNDDSIDEYARLADGGAYPAIKPVVVADTPCAIPTKDIAQKFWQLTGSMLKKAHKNRLENEELAKLRDTLLPKLLSGEIDLENLPVEQAKALAE